MITRSHPPPGRSSCRESWTTRVREDDQSLTKLVPSRVHDAATYAKVKRVRVDRAGAAKAALTGWLRRLYQYRLQQGEKRG